MQWKLISRQLSCFITHKHVWNVSYLQIKIVFSPNTKHTVLGRDISGVILIPLDYKGHLRVSLHSDFTVLIFTNENMGVKTTCCKLILHLQRPGNVSRRGAVRQRRSPEEGAREAQLESVTSQRVEATTRSVSAGQTILQTRVAPRQASQFLLISSQENKQPWTASDPEGVAPLPFRGYCACAPRRPLREAGGRSERRKGDGWVRGATPIAPTSLRTRQKPASSFFDQFAEFPLSSLPDVGADGWSLI